MYTFLRILVNSGVWMLLFWLSHSLGWVTVSEPVEQYVILICLTLIPASLISYGPVKLLDIAASVIGAVSCLLAGLFTYCIILPFIYVLVLSFAGWITGLFSVTNVWWQAYLIGMALNFIQIRPSTKNTESVDTPKEGLAEETIEQTQSLDEAVITNSHQSPFGFCPNCDTKVFPSDRSCPSCGGTLKGVKYLA